MKTVKRLTGSIVVASFLAVPFLSSYAETKKEAAKPYPLDTCIVSGEKLGEMGKAYVFTHADQEVKLCCKDCLKKFNADPAKYMKTIAEAKVYPLNTCVVSGEKLGEMGKPYVFTYEGREIKMCCKSCRKKFDNDPAKYVKKIDEAAKKKKESSGQKS